jgi:hypothetical protein
VPPGIGIVEFLQHDGKPLAAKGMGGKRLSPATIRKEIVTLRTA